MFILWDEAPDTVPTPAQWTEIASGLPGGGADSWLHSYISKSEEGHAASRTLIFRLFVWPIAYGIVALVGSLVLSLGLQKYTNGQASK